MVFDAIQERARQETLQDSKFTTAPLYYFELRVPPEATTTGRGDSYIFPLALSPNALEMSEPFTVAEAESQGGGLYVHQNGIVRRNLKIKGTTGFAPKPYQGSGFAQIKAPDYGASYGRDVASKLLVSDGVRAFSGQRHFQFLQDVVFRKYADLVQDPVTAKGTALVFHNPKDDEHWVVVPKEFRMERRRTIYDYDIDLLVVQKADSLDKDFSEEKPF